MSLVTRQLSVTERPPEASQRRAAHGRSLEAIAVRSNGRACDVNPPRAARPVNDDFRGVIQPAPDSSRVLRLGEHPIRAVDVGRGAGGPSSVTGTAMR